MGKPKRSMMGRMYVPCASALAALLAAWAFAFWQSSAHSAVPAAATAPQVLKRPDIGVGGWLPDSR